jgi:hypothetical protein
MSWRWTLTGMAATTVATFSFIIPDNYCQNATRNRKKWMENNTCEFRSGIDWDLCMSNRERIEDELKQIEEWKEQPLWVKITTYPKLPPVEVDVKSFI